MHNSSKFRPSPDFDRPAATPRTAPVALLVAALALIVCCALLVVERTRIARLIPAAAPIYASLGLDVNSRQMKLEAVVSRLTEEDGRRILVVEGEIRNIADEPREAPRIRLAVLDSAGQEIYCWTAAPPKSRLRIGETATFRARLAAPPEKGREVRVRFAANPDRPGQGS
jgi:hypothetical protein